MPGDRRNRRDCIGQPRHSNQRGHAIRHDLNQRGAIGCVTRCFAQCISGGEIQHRTRRIGELIGERHHQTSGIGPPPFGIGLPESRHATAAWNPRCSANSLNQLPSAE